MPLAAVLTLVACTPSGPIASPTRPPSAATTPATPTPSPASTTPKASPTPKAGPITSSERESDPDLPRQNLTELSAGQLLYRSPEGTLDRYTRTAWFASMTFYYLDPANDFSEHFTITQEHYFENHGRKGWTTTIKTPTLTCWEPAEHDMVSCWGNTAAEFVKFNYLPTKDAPITDETRTMVTRWISTYVGAASKTPAPALPAETITGIPTAGTASRETVKGNVERSLTVAGFSRADKDDSFVKGDTRIYVSPLFGDRLPKIDHVTTTATHVCGVSADNDSTLDCYSRHGDGALGFSIRRSYIGDPGGKTTHFYPARDKYADLTAAAAEFIPAAMAEWTR